MLEKRGSGIVSSHAKRQRQESNPWMNAAFMQLADSCYERDDLPLVYDVTSSFGDFDSSNSMIETEAFPVDPLQPLDAVQSFHAETGIAYPPGYTRPQFLQVTIKKAHPEARTGICLKALRGGGVAISSIAPNSLFARSPFQPGDRIVSINNRSCMLTPTSHVVELIRNAVSTLSIIVHNKRGNPAVVSSTVFKPKPSSLARLTLKSSRGAICVGRIHEDSLFAPSLLQAGHRCVSINDVPCNMLNSADAAALIADAPNVVTIVSRPPVGLAMVLSSGW